MAREKLTETGLAEALNDLPGWAVKDGKLFKKFAFRSFAAALGWMVAVGVQAEKMDHHPEWTNVYNRVTVTLSTHDLDDAISTWDIKLAQKMDEEAARIAG